MALETTLGAEVGSRRGITDFLLGFHGYYKPEEYSLGETMLEGFSDFCLGGSWELSPLVDSLSSKYRDELGSSGEISGEGYLGSEYGSLLGSSSVRFSGGYSEEIEVCSPGCLSNGKSSGNLRGNTLGGLLGADNGLRIWEG